MKKIFTTILLTLFVNFSFAQSFEQQMSNAAEFISKKDFCKAYEIFKSALQNEDQAGKFDYYYAAVSASNCEKTEDGLNWLNIAEQKGLGSQQSEIDYLKKDENLSKLKNSGKWVSIISSMQKRSDENKIVKEKKSKDWVSKITENAIAEKKIKFNTARPGYALYYSKVDSINVPYLVYIPKDYDISKASTTIIYLHGGIKSTEKFNDDQPEITQEPIFGLADDLNAIIIYLFGKKDFGWVNQKKAFGNIYTILKQVQKTYNVDKKKIYLGGMSNGGTATFWFASQRPSIFTGFYAISANPKLEFGEINFNFDKPFYEIHTKDDDLFNFNDVEKIYNQNKSKNWHFQLLDNGGHAIIYQKNGSEILEKLLKQLIQ